MSSAYERAQQAAAHAPYLVRWEYDDAECARIGADRQAAARRNVREELGCLRISIPLVSGGILILLLFSARNLNPGIVLLAMGAGAALMTVTHLSDIIRPWQVYRRTRQGCAAPPPRQVIIDPLMIRQTGTYLVLGSNPRAASFHITETIPLFGPSLRLLMVVLLPGDPSILSFYLYKGRHTWFEVYTGQHIQYVVPVPHGHEAEADYVMRWFRREILLQPEDIEWD